MHLIKSRVDQVVKHLVHLSRPGTARVHTGLQVKHKALEEPEDRNLGDLQEVTHALNPEPELHSNPIQVTRVDGEPSVIAASSRPLSLPLICPEHEEVDEAAAAHDTDRHIRLTPTELSVHLQNQDIHLDSFPSTTQDAVMEQADISDGATDETQDHNCSTPVQALTRREKNRLKSLRRKQRKKERWIQRQLEEKVLVSCFLTNICQQFVPRTNPVLTSKQIKIKTLIVELFKVLLGQVQEERPQQTISESDRHLKAEINMSCGSHPERLNIQLCDTFIFQTTKLTR